MTTSVATKPSDTKTARAPGKLILSGEHAVVYGTPALSVAVRSFTYVSFTPIHRSEGVRTAFENLSQGHFYPLDLLKGFKQGLDKRFDAFVRGELPVQKILHRPDDLAVYTMASLLQFLPTPGVSARHHLPVPGQLASRSELPLGAGMGSSSAVIAATIVLYEHLLGLNQTMTERFEKVRFAERLQHGKGSFIDAAAVTYGGINRVQEGAVEQISLDKDHTLVNGSGWYWVLHGSPESSTGECVQAVRKAHGKDQALWDAFAAVTAAVEADLRADADPRAALAENHRLLRKIGVVPGAAARFVEAVEASGGAAKISGAGTVRGDNAGVILVYQPNAGAMEALMEKYPERKWAPLNMARRGAHLVGAGA